LLQNSEAPEIIEVTVSNGSNGTNALQPAQPELIEQEQSAEISGTDSNGFHSSSSGEALSINDIQRSLHLHAPTPSSTAQPEPATSVSSVPSISSNNLPDPMALIQSLSNSGLIIPSTSGPEDERFQAFLTTVTRFYYDQMNKARAAETNQQQPANVPTESLPGEVEQHNQEVKNLAAEEDELNLQQQESPQQESPQQPTSSAETIAASDP